MNDIVKEIYSNPIIQVLMISCIIIIITYYLFGSKIIGWSGEHWTKQVLKKLPKDVYKVLNNIMISNNEKTHQIDHIVVSKYGIFVIETKQYNGYITGGIYDEKWVRHLKKKKIYYTNPIKQNYGHVMSVCELLNLDKEKVFNIVCIPSRATLNIQNNGELTRNDTIVKKILSYNEEIIFDVDSIINTIEENNIRDKSKRKKYVNELKIEHINDNSLSNCPWCGNMLVERNGKRGKFIGCSNYPKCRYTRNK